MPNNQPDLFDDAEARSILDTLLDESRLYKTSADYFELLQFIARFRKIAPFNAMLLNIQKPGLKHAASVKDWKNEFGRWPKENARPLLVLIPFGPVTFLYDMLDTEGRELPENAFSFPAKGPVTQNEIYSYFVTLEKKGIHCEHFDGGDNNAGSIVFVRREVTPKEQNIYKLLVNQNHKPAIQFVTLIHELAHLFLGHQGPSKELKIKERPYPDYTQRELEAESVAYLVCSRVGVKSKSETYLTNFVSENTTIENLDIYAVTKAAGQIESLLGLHKKGRS